MVEAEFSGLGAPTTNAHIHCCTVANGGTTAAAFAALLAGLDAGTAYFDIHTITYGGGEIRGFFEPVPEPGSALLALASLAALALRRRCSGVSGADGRARRRAARVSPVRSSPGVSTMRP